MALIQEIFKRIGLSQPYSKFKPGDQVQLISGDALMIVEWVKESKENPPRPIICCKWFDSNVKQSKLQVFDEDELKQFDWHYPY